MPTDIKHNETLTVRGVLDRAGRFRPRRCTSTTFVRRWPPPDSSELTIELLDRRGQVLLREPVRLRPRHGCDAGDLTEWNLTGYVALREDGELVALRRGDVELWRAEVREAPRFDVTLARSRASRERGATLSFRFSEPYEGAFLQVVYQWGERRHHVVALIEPRDTLDVDLASLPGGPRCRFVVQYSNGMRSAGAVTREFALEPLGPALTIVKPPARAVLLPGRPLELEGQVVHPEQPRGPRRGENLTWIVDEQFVGRGMIAGLDKLAAGRHRITLRYSPPEGEPAEVSRTVTVARAGEDVPADEWPEWDDWLGLL
jgi:hypothetical protein